MLAWLVRHSWQHTSHTCSHHCCVPADDDKCTCCYSSSLAESTSSSAGSMARHSTACSTPQSETSSISDPGLVEGQAGPQGMAEAATSCHPAASTVEDKSSLSSGCKAASGSPAAAGMVEVMCMQAHLSAPLSCHCQGTSSATLHGFTTRA